MLNPSTADAKEDDPTIRRCIGFARRWGFGAVDVVNLFAFRATNPKELKTVDDPIGPDNKLILMGPLALPVVVGWGGGIVNVPFHKAVRMEEMMKNRARREHGEWFCLGWTKTGDPRHPLMLPYNTKLVLWP